MKHLRLVNYSIYVFHWNLFHLSHIDNRENWHFTIYLSITKWAWKLRSRLWKTHLTQTQAMHHRDSERMRVADLNQLIYLAKTSFHHKILKKISSQAMEILTLIILLLWQNRQIKRFLQRKLSYSHKIHENFSNNRLKHQNSLKLIWKMILLTSRKARATT